MMLSLAMAALISGSVGPRDHAATTPEPSSAWAEESLLREAKTLRYAQRWWEAVQKYRAFINGSPRSPRLADARFWLAASLEQNQQWDEAARAYGEFLQLHPEQRMLGREARLNRIHCWGMRKGQALEAIPGLVAALDDPLEEVQVAAALELAQRKDRRALTALRKGLALPPYADACSLALVSMGVKPEPAAIQARFLAIRIKETGKAEVVTIRLAMSLARAVENYLSDVQIRQARSKGFDLDNLMDQATRIPKGSILFSVEDRNSSVTITVE